MYSSKSMNQTASFVSQQANIGDPEDGLMDRQPEDVLLDRALVGTLLVNDPEDGLLD